MTRAGIEYPEWEPQPWKLEAACRGMDPALFFPERGESSSEAKRVCGLCPVRAECLEFALGSYERHGIWGGHSERQRRRIRVPSTGGKTAVCGTESGYNRHRRAGEAACDACRKANAVAKANRKDRLAS